MIELLNVSKEYGLTKALDNVSLKIEKGEFVGVMGPSGSGKSTLLNIIGAIEKPSSGKVFLFDKEISSLSTKELLNLKRSKVGFIFQFYYLLEDFTVFENVYNFGKLFNKSIKKEDVLNILEKVGIKNKLKNRPSELSGGQQQRTAIARALIINPILIIADEPTGNLSHDEGLNIINMLKDLSKKEGKTVVVATHNQEFIPLFDRVIKLRDGKLID